MNKNIFTGNYDECKAGNLISISGDRGKSVGFNGKAIPALAPKREFWNIWHANIGKVPEEDNTAYYIQQYYKEVLLKVNLEQLLEGEEDPILLCFEKGQQFCHRHILAEYIEMKYKVKVKDIKIDENFNITENKRPENIKCILQKIIANEDDN